MPLFRMIETTIMRDDQASGVISDTQPASFLFIPARLPEDIGAEEVMSSLGIMPFRSFGKETIFVEETDALAAEFFSCMNIVLTPPISARFISANHLSLDFHSPLIDRASQTRQLAEIRDWGTRLFQQSYEPKAFGTGLYELIAEKIIIIEKSPPQLIDFISIVKTGSGAAIGAYTGYLAGQALPLLLLVTVPSGILICAAAMGLGQALEQGLRTRVHQLLLGVKSPPQNDRPIGLRDDSH